MSDDLTIAYMSGAADARGTIKMMQKRIDELEEQLAAGEASDGYHTHNELYNYRKLYNALLFNEWHLAGRFNVYKSLRHYDGNLCFGGGWFVVVAETPHGQITNHYEVCDWDMFDIPAFETVRVEYDGHTPADVAATMVKVCSMPLRNQEIPEDEA